MFADGADAFGKSKNLRIGICIPPKPNRLVLFCAEVNHIINGVETAAGEGTRIAVAESFIASRHPLDRYRRG